VAASDGGVIFSFDLSSSTYTKVQDFDGANGANPYGSLMQAVDGKLYGMTYQGGSSGNGVVFSFDPSSSAYTTRRSLIIPTAAILMAAWCRLLTANCMAMTVAGGSSGNGVVFSFDLSSSAYTTVKEFDGANGSNPSGSLMQAADGNLYGMTYGGGSSNYGVIFSFDPSSSAYTKKKDFGTNTTGAFASASLVKASNGKLYGMTYEGGSIGFGVIFPLIQPLPRIRKCRIFDGANGANPLGSLMQASDGKLYGMTYRGGSGGAGVVFSFDPSSSAYTKLQEFDFNNGGYPFGSLVQASNGKLYGMTYQGGSSGAGVIFSFDPSSSTYTQLQDFGGANGAYPYGSLMQASNGKLYGMTLVGGSSGNGVVFSFDLSSSAYTTVKEFDITNGRYPVGRLVQASNGKLYGMTYQGGSSGAGVVFSFDPSSSAYTKVQDFDGANGTYPLGSLVQASNGKLYGMTFQGGSSDAGVVFSFDPSSSAYTKVQDFDGANGARPYLGSAFIEGRQASNITTSVNSNNFCVGSSLNVAYTATGSYGAANIFTAQLSNASGSFANPVAIGNTTSATSGTIEAVIPANTTSGTGYRIRVVSSNKAVIGSDNGNDITITALVTFYLDGDGDGYGDNSKPVQACSAPQGSFSKFFVTDNTDCDDSKASVHPGAAEVCNGVDDNCDGQIDEGVKTTFYADTDGDGYGNNSITTQACSAPTGYVSDNTDCDDTKASAHLNATEVCNGVDDDCDGQIDEGIPTVTYYRDGDRDGYGNPADNVTSCSPPTGYVTNSTDCDDTKSSIHPGAVEVCANGIDDNCNGLTDENCGTVPRISINDVTVYESEGVAVLTISLDRVSTSAISINYATQSGTAIGSGKGVKTFDFTSASGSVTIAAGTKTAQIRITITKDNIAEVAENFKVNLSLDAKNAKKATITRSSGTVTINDGINQP
jgi:uncharacterized repeat protein (TIGR03803 family)